MPIFKYDFMITQWWLTFLGTLKSSPYSLGYMRYRLTRTTANITIAYETHNWCPQTPKACYKGGPAL